MKRKRFTESQIAFALRQVEGGTPVAEITRRLGISEVTFYRWKKKFAGSALKKALRPSVKRVLAEEMKHSYQISERRACSNLTYPRSVIRYRSVADPQVALRMRLRELAAARVGYGYRRLHILLWREGWEVNHKRVYRLYCERRIRYEAKASQAAQGLFEAEAAPCSIRKRVLEHGFYVGSAL
jgi:putative transposase